MQIELVQDPELIERLGQSDAPRSRDRLHLSDIYKDLMQGLQPKRFRGGPMNMAKVETGLVMENMLERGLAEKFATVRPGELVSDEGIYMSPDGVNPTFGCGEEYKCTWASSRIRDNGTTPYTDEYGMPNVKYMHWFFQMKGYAKWLQTDSFLMRVLHVNGDYERIPGVGLQPQFLTHRVWFSQDEIEDNWSMLMRHARTRKMMI